MSFQATSFVIEQSRHKGSAFVVLLMIANHAHSDGTGAYPSVDTLAKESRITPRQVKRILPELEASGELVVFWSHGRKPHEYAIDMGEKNSDKLSLLKAAYNEKLAETNSDNLSPLKLAAEPRNSDKMSPLTVTSAPPNSDICDSAHNKGLNSKEKKKESARATAPPPAKRAGKPADPRSTHPAIVAVRDLASQFPPKPIWDTIIAVLGDKPNTAKLEMCRTAWVGSGKNPVNFAWVVDWYQKGIPAWAMCFITGPDRRKDPAPEPVTAPPRPPRPKRPPKNVPPQQRDAWRALLAAIERRVNQDVFQTWFKPLEFEGLNIDSTAFVVRAGRITVDWVQRYYAGTIIEAFIESGMAEFTIKWEIEEEEVFEDAI